MFSDGMGTDWVITLLCSMTDRSAVRSSSDESLRDGGRFPRGASLRMLSSMMGVQESFLETNDTPRPSLAAESEELLQFVNMLNYRRDKSRMDAQSSLSALEQKLSEKRKRLSEERRWSGLLGRYVDALNRIDKYVDALMLLADYAKELRAMLADEDQHPEEQGGEAITSPEAVNDNGELKGYLSNINKQLSMLWKDLSWWQWDEKRLGVIWDDLFLTSLYCLEFAMRSEGRKAQRAFATAAVRLASTSPNTLSEKSYYKGVEGIVEHLPLLLDVTVRFFGYVDALFLLWEYKQLWEDNQYHNSRSVSLGEWQRKLKDSIGMATTILRDVWGDGHLQYGRKGRYEEYVKLLRGEAVGCRAEIKRIGEDARTLIGVLEKRIDTLRRGEYELKRTIDGICAEISQCSNCVVLATMLTPVGEDFVGSPVQLTYDEATSTYRPESDIYGSEPKPLKEWVSHLEDLTGARDVYIYLEYSEDGDGAYSFGKGERHAGLWGDDTYESWFVPTDLLRLPGISQSTDNPVDYIYPVREYGAPYESFGSRRRNSFEEFIGRVDEAQESGSAIYIPYEKRAEHYEHAKDVLSLRIDEDGKEIISLEAEELDRYDPIFPLRRYPKNGDGEVPLLGMNLEGEFWLIDLGSARIDLGYSGSRGARLFSEVKEFARIVPESVSNSFASLDCWGVASNNSWKPRSQHASRRDCSEGRPDNAAPASSTAYRLEDGEAIRLRFFEIVRRNGSYGYVLSKARDMLLKHGWEPDEEAVVLDETGHMVECVWQTPKIEGFTIVGIQNLKQFVLSFGSDVVVESPAWLRAWHIGLACKEAEKLQLKLEASPVE